jgi:hypothetical protein
MKECTICLETIQKHQECYLLCKCNYVYHKKCIELWRNKQDICPICRKSLCIPDIDDKIDVFLEYISYSIFNCVKNIIAKIIQYE